MEEDIERVKEFIHNTAIYYIGMPSSLTNILKELERLQNENQMWQEYKNKLDKLDSEDFISRQVIKDKIEELEKEIKQFNEYVKARKETDVEYYENIANTFTRNVLQELLENGGN